MATRVRRGAARITSDRADRRVRTTTARGSSRWPRDDAGHVPRAPGDGEWPPTATGTATGVA